MTNLKWIAIIGLIVAACLMASGCVPEKQYGRERTLMLPGPDEKVWAIAPVVNLCGQQGVDPVLQAATGITARYGTPEAPVMHGVASCVDYISGFCAALGVAQALVARKEGRGGSLVRTSLAMGAQLVQFPFVVDAARDGAEVGGQQVREVGHQVEEDHVLREDADLGPVQGELVPIEEE